MTETTRLEMFGVYLASVRRFSQRTVIAYVTDVDQFLAIGPLSATDNAPQRFVDSLSNYAPRTVRRKVSAVRTYLKFCAGLGDFVPEFPALSLPKMSQRLPSMLTTSQMALFLSETDKISLRDQLMIYFAYTAGLRVGEIALVRIGDIDLYSGYIHVRGKGDRERVVPLGLELERRISQYVRVKSSQQCKPSDFLFSATGSGGLSIRAIQLVIKRTLIKAGLSGKLSVHSLRHSAASHLLADGATVRDVQRFLGHQRIATTQVYTHVVTGHLRNAIQIAHPRY